MIPFNIQLRPSGAADNPPAAAPLASRARFARIPRWIRPPAKPKHHCFRAPISMVGFRICKETGSSIGVIARSAATLYCLHLSCTVRTGQCEAISLLNKGGDCFEKSARNDLPLHPIQEKESPSIGRTGPCPGYTRVAPHSRSNCQLADTTAA